MTWKLKRDVQWHDGRPFTSADCRLQLGIRLRSGDCRGDHRLYKDVKVESRPVHGPRRVREADAVLGRPFVGARGMIIPKHLFEPYKGAKSREAPNNLKPVGTGPTSSPTSPPATW